jgi:hypothetical protein
VSPLSYWSSLLPLRVTVRVRKHFISTDWHFLIFQDSNHLSFWWLALRNIMILLIGSSRVAVLCVCLFSSTRDEKWRVLCLTTVEVFLLQNGSNCIFFPHVLTLMTTSCRLTVATKALLKRCAVGNVSYSTHFYNLSEIQGGNLSTWYNFHFWNLWQGLSYSTRRPFTVTRYWLRRLIVFSM